jgi:hypothetical protein
MTVVSIEKGLKWRVLSAVCLKNGHCVFLNKPPTFCGLTDNFFSFPPAIVVPLFCANFLLEWDIQLWGVFVKDYTYAQLRGIIGNLIDKTHNKIKYFRLMLVRLFGVVEAWLSYVTGFVKTR